MKKNQKSKINAVIQFYTAEIDGLILLACSETLGVIPARPVGAYTDARGPLAERERVGPPENSTPTPMYISTVEE